MKAIVAVWLASASFVGATGNVSAHDVRNDTERLLSQDTRPEVRPRSCEQVGSGLYERTYDINCWDDDVQQASICIRVVLNMPEGSAP